MEKFFTSKRNKILLKLHQFAHLQEMENFLLLVENFLPWWNFSFSSKPASVPSFSPNGGSGKFSTLVYGKFSNLVVNFPLPKNLCLLQNHMNWNILCSNFQFWLNCCGESGATSVPNFSSNGESGKFPLPKKFRRKKYFNFKITRLGIICRGGKMSALSREFSTLVKFCFWQPDLRTFHILV